LRSPVADASSGLAFAGARGMAEKKSAKNIPAPRTIIGMVVFWRIMGMVDS